MKTVFMGTPDFAIPCLKKLSEEHDIIAVITQPDRPRGRGKKIQPPPVKREAQKLGIRVYQPLSIKDEEVLSLLKHFDPEAIVVVAYGQILPEFILEFPPKGCVNVHASILPKYRGAAPIHWAIINGEKETGITTMLMDKGLDTGDILLQKKIRITSQDTAGTLHDKLADLGAELLIETLEKIESGTIKRTKQNEKEATYAPMLDRQVERIQWNCTAEEIYNKVRGLNPWPGSYTTINNKRLKIWKVKINEEDITSQKSQPGEILDVDIVKGITVATGKGSIIIKELQLQGKKRMTASEFLKGYNIQPGLILGLN